MITFVPNVLLSFPVKKLFLLLAQCSVRSEGGIAFSGVCFNFVCLFVCQHHSSRTVRDTIIIDLHVDSFSNLFHFAKK